MNTNDLVIYGNDTLQFYVYPDEKIVLFNKELFVKMLSLLW